MSDPVLELDALDLARDLQSWKAPAHSCHVVSRTDIDFFNVSQDVIAVEIKLTNEGDAPSPPDTLVLRAAPFGAFVPWQPLISLPLPVIAPGSVRYVRSRAIVSKAAALGSPDRVPPRRLLTALGLADDPPDERASESLAKPPAQAPAAVLPRHSPATMPAGLMDLLMQETPHWAGNINVMVGRSDVERHQAKALRVYPGRLNMAWFVVGAFGPDAYAFRLHGLGTDWNAQLFDMTSRETLVAIADDNSAIAPDEWIATKGSRTILLALRVPRKCAAGNVEVHVTQRSTGRNAVVEFSLDPRASGRGCYAV
jgi:hypothetical protein